MAAILTHTGVLDQKKINRYQKTNIRESINIKIFRHQKKNKRIAIARKSHISAPGGWIKKKINRDQQINKIKGSKKTNRDQKKQKGERENRKPKNPLRREDQKKTNRHQKKKEEEE